MGAESVKVHIIFFLFTFFLKKLFPPYSFPSSARDEFRSSDMTGKVLYHSAIFSRLRKLVFVEILLTLQSSDIAFQSQC